MIFLCLFKIKKYDFKKLPNINIFELIQWLSSISVAILLGSIPNLYKSPLSPIPQTIYNITSSNSRSSVNSYSSSMTTNGYGIPGRQYSEVSEGLYHEISDNVYSQVPEEVLRPHRPAPTKPGLQPLSMQQIQRKIQQGQVKYGRNKSFVFDVRVVLFLAKFGCWKTDDKRI